MKHKESFTLIELLIVVAIVGMLAATIIFTFGGVLNRSEAKIHLNEVKTVKRYVESQNVLKATPDQIAVGLVDVEGSTPAKIIGSWNYITKELAKDSGGSACRRVSSQIQTVLAKYLNEISDGDFINIYVESDGTRFVGNSALSSQYVIRDSDDFICSSDENIFAIAVRINDEGVWWCGTSNRTKRQNAGYYETSFSERFSDKPVVKNLDPSCRLKGFLFSPENEIYNLKPVINTDQAGAPGGYTYAEVRDNCNVRSSYAPGEASEVNITDAEEYITQNEKYCECHIAGGEVTREGEHNQEYCEWLARNES